LKLVAKGKAPVEKEVADKVREEVAEQLILSDTDSNEDMLVVDEPRSDESSVARKSEVNDPCVRKPTKPSRPYSFLKSSKIRRLRSVVSEPFRPKRTEQQQQHVYHRRKPVTSRLLAKLATNYSKSTRQLSEELKTKYSLLPMRMIYRCWKLR